LRVQVNDVHKWGNHQGVAQCQRQAVTHRQIIQCRRAIPVRVLVPA
jgi:hypothetical protein